MWRRLLLVGIVLGAIWMLGACGPKVVKVEQAENDSSVELRVGSELVVTLDANPTTGYMWEVDDVDWGLLEPQGEPVHEPSSTITGAGGKTTFRYKALKAGEATLRLIYRRPWEATQIPEDTFTLHVKIRP